MKAAEVQVYEHLFGDAEADPEDTETDCNHCYRSLYTQSMSDFAKFLPH